MDVCIFCRIVRREQPATVVLNTTDVLGIVPLEPVLPGHTLLLPKRHFADLFDIDAHVLVALAVEAKHLAVRLRREFRATGVNLLHASGRDAQQSVFHFHLHVVPRYPGDGHNLWLRSVPS